MSFAIVIASWNDLETTTCPCLDSVLRNSGPECRVIVVDKASTDGTGDYLSAAAAADPRLTVIRNAANLVWAGGTLRGLELFEPRDSHVCRLNSDTLVSWRR